MSKTLYIYRASAGSGKTFTLAVEYIRLLIADPTAYRHTLAVTFTNKATGEMKERILEQLYGIAHSLPSSQSYYEKISDTFPNMSEQEIRSRANNAMHNMLHDYGHFRIQTIDAFFQSILRGLARELELSGDIEITINGKKLLEDCVDLMIKRLTPDCNEMKWLVEYIKEHLENAKNWNVRSAIKNFAQNILKEEYQERSDKMREQITESAGKLLVDYRKAVRAVEDDIISQVKSIADSFFAIAKANNLDVNDFSYKKSGIWGHFTKLKAGLLIPLGKRSLDCLQEPLKISSKLPQTECYEIASLLEKNQTLYDENIARLNSCKLSLTRFHQLRLLNSIADTLVVENNSENRFILSQTTYLLSRMIDNDTSFIFEKIGTEINHIFIDEFQDTSKLQWDCFKVLLDEVMSRGGFNLIVGDVKQAIYRWRNSDWNILNKIDTYFPVGTIGNYNTEKLKSNSEKTINYRSQQNVVDFNNALFREAVKIINGTYATDLGVRLNDLNRAYNDVEQIPNNDEAQGYAEVRLLDSENKNENKAEASRKQLTETLHTLLEEEGVNPSDITILVRNKNEVANIVADFNREFPRYSIVSESAYNLSSSVALRILIAAMRYIQHPDDNLNTIELAIAYNRFINKKEFTSAELFSLKDSPIAVLPKSLKEKQEALSKQPINEIIEQLITILNINSIDAEEPYIYSFLDHSAEYLQKNNCNIDDLLRAWDEELSEKSIPEGQNNSVRIMTIHKSKGLEFHTVIVPFCYGNITKEWHKSRKEKILWCHPEGAPFDLIDLLPIEYSEPMRQSAYSNDYYNETLFELVDNLNLLYVAFTRASHNLFVFSNKNLSDNSTQQMISLAIKNITLNGAAYDNTNELFTYGKIMSSEQRDEQKEKKKEENKNPFSMKSNEKEQPFVSYENRLMSRQSNNLARFLATSEQELQDTEYMDIGELLHEIMSHLITGEELEQELQRKQMQGLIASNKAREKISRLIKRALDNPIAADWFSGRYKIFNECNMLYRDGKQRVCRPDRVMIDDNSAIVLDFKFARPTDKHKEQVQNYMENLIQMGYSNVKGYLWYIYKNSIEPVKLG